MLMIASVACIKMTPSHHFKTYEGLKYDTTIIDRQHQIIKRSKPAANAIISLSFTALNRSFTLELWPSKDVFADNPQFLVHTNTSTMIPSDYDMSSFYRGRLKGHSLSRVYGHIIDGIFDGEVMTGDGVHYHVEHVKNYHIEDDPLVHSIIYSNYDIIRHPLKESLCGVKDELMNKLLSLQSTAASASHNYSYPNQKRLHKKSLNRGSYCQIFVAVDHLFLANVAGNSEVDAIREVVAVFASSQTIFLTTDFDSDGSPDFITPQLVKTEVLTSDSYNGIFASNDIPVEEFLDKWSQIDHTSYCLSLLLTYRDFANGILGLAWIAQPSGGSRGGVCEGRVLLSVGERSLNTAIVSYLNYGSRQPRSIMSITVTHEFGHNFGSSHDPITDACSPGGTDGNYLMYSRATDGALPNNRLFSPCSISSINTVLQSKSSCFKSAGSFCGNLIREGDESCDCGDDVNCIMTDPCCSPTQCVLKPTASCSALDECCDNCRIDVSGRVCRVETECANSSSCNRISSLCPRPASKDKSCNNGTRYCMDGECIGNTVLYVLILYGW
jgi:disintegrin and metalloproteinase domain-containing protein 10